MSDILLQLAYFMGTLCRILWDASLEINIVTIMNKESYEMYYFRLHLSASKKKSFNWLAGSPHSSGYLFSGPGPSVLWSLTQGLPAFRTTFPFSFFNFLLPSDYEVNFAPEENPDQTPHFPEHPRGASDQTEQLTQQTMP